MKTFRSIPCAIPAIALMLATHAPALAQDHDQAHVQQAGAQQPAATDGAASHDHAGDHKQHGEKARAQDHVHDVQTHADHAAYPPAPPESPGADHTKHNTAAYHAAHAAHTMEPAAPAEEPLTPIPVVTDADRAAAFPELHHAMQHGSDLHSFMLVDRLEAWDADHGSGQAWEAQAWIGGDLSRLWLRSEGVRVDGHTESANLEVLYGRSVSAWWDVVGGVRHDFQPGSPQTWAAIGLQGLAPYKFEVQATAYLGESGQTAANIEVEYELLLTNRLILQPLVEVEWHGKDDPRRGVGSGLGKLEAGLRLRYEFTRRFAPYVGVVHERAFGGTADLHEAAGEDPRDTRVVAGLRLWF